MTSKDESRPQEEGRTENRRHVPPANDQVRQDEQIGKQGAPEPGTEGPKGHVDDQPQREDEYLSRMLKEFNPQRKDQKGPSGSTDTRSASGANRQNNDS